MSLPSEPRDPAGLVVANTLFRALAVLRVVLIANTAVLYLYRYDGYPHPALGFVIIAALAVWTFVSIWAYARPRLRYAPLLITDLAFAVGAILSTELVKGDGFRATLPGFWVMSAVLAWAVRWRITGGLIAASAIVAADVTARQHLTQGNWASLFLIVLGGLMIGFLADLLATMADERDRAERAAAAAAERQRLGRVVHDGVLQVLALVQKRGGELGGEAAELGRLAGEQEVSLRAYVQSTVPVADALDPSVRVDLAAALSALATTAVSVAVPGTRVEVGARAGAEITAAVAACLSNVRHHVGRDAPAWVLLEDLGDQLVVSVRDQGPGIPTGRLEQAAAEGRMGVSGSIRSRIESLGGVADLASLPSGTEWEFRIPKDAS
ncbi:MAG: MacS family sensor histidine kinase [Marmoricola sp.]